MSITHSLERPAAVLAALLFTLLVWIGVQGAGLELNGQILRAGHTAEPGTATPQLLRETTGAARLHAGGITGAGVGIALVDSGVAPVAGLHDGVVRADVVGGSGVDGFGHGTHMAGIIAGSEGGAAQAGMAPDATLVSVRVADDLGATTASSVAAGITWAVEHRDAHDIRVLVVAWDAVADTGVVARAAAAAADAGILVVTSAGNDGPARPLSDFAASPEILAVGAVDTRGTGTPVDDVRADFSSGGDAVELYAPGVRMLSAGVPESTLWLEHPPARRDGGQFRGHGTSQAAAVVGGAAALVFDAHPDWTAEEVRAALVSRTSGADGVRTLNVAAAVGGGLDEHAWDGYSWDGYSWDGYSWDGYSWDGYSWDGYSWDGYSWDGYSWD